MTADPEQAKTDKVFSFVSVYTNTLWKQLSQVKRYWFTGSVAELLNHSHLFISFQDPIRYPVAVFFIVFNAFCDRFAFYGIRGKLKRAFWEFPSTAVYTTASATFCSNFGPLYHKRSEQN